MVVSNKNHYASTRKNMKHRWFHGVTTMLQRVNACFTFDGEYTYNMDRLGFVVDVILAFFLLLWVSF